MISTSLEARVDGALMNKTGADFSNPAFFGPGSVSLPSVHPFRVAESLSASAKRAAERPKAEQKALSEAIRNRLVRASKSQTDVSTPKGERSELPYFRQKAECLKGRSPDFVGPKVHTREMLEADPQDNTRTESKGPGQFTVIQFREWSDEYRIRTRVEIPGSAPQAQEGERVSYMLTDRGARNIADSCHYMALKKGGYKTFVTGTFDQEAREAIATGKTTIQKEVTRTMDAMRKMYLRGWTTKAGEFIKTASKWEYEPVLTEQGEATRERAETIEAAAPFTRVWWREGKLCKANHTRLRGALLERVKAPYTKIKRVNKQTEGLAYCWVVECPLSKDENGEYTGEENPHIHLMMNWEVPYRLFQEWKDRIEGLWGNGYFHLEKIKEPEHAGAYMAKAAGYLGKGKTGDQGRVAGNRFGISKPARAPGWCCLGDYELGVMGRLITEVHEHMQRKYEKDREKREMLTRAKKKATKKKDRARIGAALVKVREKLKAVPFIASKYQLVCKGKAAFTKFIGRAAGAGWDSSYKPPSLWLEEFDRRQRIRKRRSWLHYLTWNVPEIETEDLDHMAQYYDGMPVDQDEEPGAWEEWETMGASYG